MRSPSMDCAHCVFLCCVPLPHARLCPVCSCWRGELDLPIFSEEIGLPLLSPSLFTTFTFSFRHFFLFVRGETFHCFSKEEHGNAPS